MEPRAVFLDERRLDLIEHADGLEYVERLREERLAEMETREALLLEHDDARSTLHQAGGADGPTRTAADHDDVERFSRAHDDSTPALLPLTFQVSVSRRSSAAARAGCARRCMHRSA